VLRDKLFLKGTFMTTATAQAFPNIAFIKYRLAKLD
jgi:mevalonate pyrophosphate decarboxylase